MRTKKKKPTIPVKSFFAGVDMAEKDAELTSCVIFCSFAGLRCPVCGVNVEPNVEHRCEKKGESCQKSS